MDVKRETKRVVMLPTKKAPKDFINQIILDEDGLSIITAPKSGPIEVWNRVTAKYCTPQHLYIIDESAEIKDRDWFIPISGEGWKLNVPRLADSNGGFINNHCKKIIATTDTSLNLPQPSVDFVKAYIKAHNEGNPIEYVDVEYYKYAEAYRGKNPNIPDEILHRLRIDKNNCITIHPIKNSWNKKEILALAIEAYHLDYTLIEFIDNVIKKL